MNAWLDHEKEMARLARPISRRAKLIWLAMVGFVVVVTPLCALKAFDSRQVTPSRTVPIEYRFTLREVADALKAKLKEQNPLMDVSGEDFAVVWRGLGREGEPDFVARWESTFPDHRPQVGQDATNFCLILRP